MTTRLLNSAIMPQPGTYSLSAITSAEMAALIRMAAHMGELASYIGYQQTADYLSTLSGATILVSREPTAIEDGDILLICRLRYRVGNPADKRAPIDPADLEFFLADYRAPEGK